jgi:glycogen operon protein
LPACSGCGNTLNRELLQGSPHLWGDAGQLDVLHWHVFANTALPPPEDACPPGEERLLSDQRRLLVGERSVVILVGRETIRRGEA